MEQRKICIFCNLDEDNELLYGKIYELDGDIVTHYYCLLLSSNLEQNGRDNDGILGFLREDILKECRRGRRLICWYCKRSGATLGCCTSRCKKVFHLPCGRRAGSLHQFFGQFKSFCGAHRPIQKIDPQVLMEVKSKEAICAICYDSIQSTSCPSTLWAPCCRINAWFHRDCVQKLAMSAGYFFKCPLCNNTSTFQKAMLDFGIYIPEQDASWELVPNAFQELLQRHNRCDAKQCLCPKGRVHESHGTRWELVLCRYCGSQGIHVGCGPLKWVNPEWECDECKTMLEQAQGRDDTDSDEETAPSPSCVSKSPPKRKRQYYRGFGRSRRTRHHNDRAIASSSDPVPSSSQNLETPNSQSMMCGPVSPPTPIAVIDVSDDDIEILLDDNEPPVKRSTQDNSNMILSCDGVTIPVVQVPSIQNVCVVGDVNVKISGLLNNVQQAAVHEVTQTHSVSAVSQVPTSNTAPVCMSGTNFSGSSVEDSSSSKSLSSSSTSCNSSQSYGSASASGMATSGGGMLKSCLMFENAHRGQPYTNQVSSAAQQTVAEPLLRTASVLANSRQAQNPDCTSRIQHLAARTACCSAAVPASRKLCNRPYRVRNDRRQDSSSAGTGTPSQRESQHTVDRVTLGKDMLDDFRFIVTGLNTLQVVFLNNYVVKCDLQLPRVSKQLQNPMEQSLSTVPQNETAAICDSNVSPQVACLRNPEQSARHSVQETVLECSPLPCHDDSPRRQDTALCNSSVSQMSPGGNKVPLIERNRVSSVRQICKRKRSLGSSQIAGENVPSCPRNANTVGSRSSRRKNTSISKCSLDPVTGLRPRSPVYTRSRRERTCLKLRHINGRKRLFQSTVVPFPASGCDLFNRSLQQSRRALRSLQNSVASQSEFEMASSSQCEAGGTRQKQRIRSFSCSEAVENPFFTNEFKDKILSQTAQECNTELVLDKPANDLNKVTVISNSSNTSTENHSLGNVEKQTCYNNMITGVDKILSKVLDHRHSNELCMNDTVRMKAKALAARKFRPMSHTEDLQRKMMRELQSLHRPPQT